MISPHLEVYLSGAHIGILEPRRNGLRFKFDEDVAATQLGSPLLSVALLVQEGQVDTVRTHNWFAGLLPEDTRLEALERFFGIAQGDYASILEDVGWECAGAIEILPAGRESQLYGKQAFQTILAEELAARLRALPSHPYDTPETLRVSLGGYQEKLCVSLSAPMQPSGGLIRLEECRIPLNGAISTHILKPQPQRFPLMIDGEAWAMTVAAQVTETAKAALLELDDAPRTLIVERYDRSWQKGVPQRLHQEDCAQALGIESSRKYAATGVPTKSDPSYVKIARLLQGFSADPVHELGRLCKQMTVNVVLGNTDAHAKNYSLLHPTGQTVSLAPLYDVVPALELTPGTLFMGMRVDGRIRIDRIEREELENEARSWGLSQAHLRQCLDETIDSLREGIAQANDCYPQAAEVFSPPSLRRLERIGA
jgi:serine/threonine-protein kinase HipA